VRTRGAVSVLVAMVFVCVGSACGHGDELSRVLPRKSVFPDATYSVAKVQNCYVKLHVLAGVSTAENTKEGFAKAHASVNGLTGEIHILGAGAAPTPIGKGLGVDKKPAGLDLGPPINSVDLIFFGTAAQAREALKSVAKVYVFRTAAPEKEQAFLTELYGPPPPVRAVPDFVFLAGNVEIFWTYPLAHMALSNRLLKQCLAAGRV
jgi:hypothetical protein